MKRYAPRTAGYISNDPDHSGRSVSHHLIWAASSQINGRDLNTEEVCPVLISIVYFAIDGHRPFFFPLPKSLHGGAALPWQTPSPEPANQHARSPKHATHAATRGGGEGELGGRVFTTVCRTGDATHDAAARQSEETLRRVIRAAPGTNSRRPGHAYNRGDQAKPQGPHAKAIGSPQG
jgi:hypothetical protein